jgi:hypothetical protein
MTAMVTAPPALNLLRRLAFGSAAYEPAPQVRLRHPVSVVTLQRRWRCSTNRPSRIGEAGSAFGAAQQSE